MRKATRATVATVAALGTAACTPTANDNAMPSPPTVQQWRCGDTLLETRLVGDNLHLRLPGATHRLEPQAAASGARFGNAAGMQFWSKGDDTALLRRGHDRAESSCQPSQERSPWLRAADAAIDLRAAGNEPAWILEAHEDGSVRLLLDYGQRTLRFEERTPLAAGRGFSAAHDGQQLKVSVSDAAACTDSMSGHRFPLVVRVQLDDAPPLNGCGRAYGAPGSVSP